MALPFILLLCMLVTACSRSPCASTTSTGETNYDRCLRKYESVTAVRPFGPFTVLDIHYSEPFGYFGAKLTYHRILHNGRTLIKRADRLQDWPEARRAALLVEYPGKDGLRTYLHLLYEQGGEPVIERIVEGDAGWVANEQFSYGYPLGPHRRYFPRYIGAPDAGFLLSIFPTQVVTLPSGPQGVGVPWAQALAGIAPDGSAYAYTDSETAPSVLVLVNGDGQIGDPQPISITSPVSAKETRTNPFDPLWRWFSASYRWEKNTADRWRIVEIERSSVIRASNPIEELFVDASGGYPTCFDPKNPSCLSGWHLVANPGEVLGDCCISRYVYSPDRRTTAFDTDVLVIAFSRGLAPAAGYKLLLNATPAQVSAALEERLVSRRIRFASSSECETDAAYEAMFDQIVQLEDPIEHDELFRATLAACSSNAKVFVTASGALAVYPASSGRSWIYTIGRYKRARGQTRQLDKCPTYLVAIRPCANKLLSLSPNNLPNGLMADCRVCPRPLACTRRQDSHFT